jgi:fructose-bisphosphate aldolase class II
MFDGSHHPLAENIALTAEIVRRAHAAGVSVEAELGRLSGVEDKISVDELDAIYTNPKEAQVFVVRNGVDSLAIAIGTAPGQYKGIPRLDYDRLDTIKKLLRDHAHWLHGASGLTEEQLKKCVSLGVNKINIDTDIRLAMTAAIKEAFEKKPSDTIRANIWPAREAIPRSSSAKSRCSAARAKPKPQGRR